MCMGMLRRNLDLWEDRKLFNDTFVHLSKKYAITPVRCRQIYLKVENRYQLYMSKDFKGVPMYMRKFEKIERFYFERAAYFRKEKKDVSSNNKNDPV